MNFGIPIFYAVSQIAENVKNIYGLHTVTISRAHFWFCRFRKSGNFDVKIASRRGSPIVKNINEIT